MFVRHFTSAFTVAVMLACAGATNVWVNVNPLTGVDSPSCNTTKPCQTIAYAVQWRNASIISLAAAVFNEPSVPIIGVLYLIINGTVGSVFDCSLRASGSVSSGPAFIVANSSVVISGVIFQNCTNFNVIAGIGGAVSADTSSISVNNCSFFNNLAQIGGA